MRKLEARWDADVPRPDADEGEAAEPDRIHLGIRLRRGRHETDEAATMEGDAKFAELKASTTGT